MVKFFIVLFCLGSSLLIGQVQYNLQVLDAETGAPIPTVQALVISAGDTSLEISNDQGWLRFKSPKNCEIKLMHLSYQNLAIRPSTEQNLYLKPKVDHLEEVVVTGQGHPTSSIKAVRNIKILGQQRIKQQAAINLSDLLSNELNLQVSEDGILGSQISVQGLDGAKVKILIDGVPVIGRLGGNIDIGQLNLNDIERVEVVEGPMAIQYGTDALAGTINLITKRSANKRPQYQVTNYFESVGRYNFDGSASLPIGNWHGKIGLGRYFFNGFSLAENRRNLAWNPKEQYFGNLRLQRRFGKVLLRYRVEYFWEEITNKGNIGSFDSLISPVDTGAWKYPRALDDYYLTQRLNNAVDFDYFLSPKIKISGFVAYNYFQRRKTTFIKNLNTGDQTRFGGLDAQDTSIFNSFASRSFISHQLNNNLNYQLGYDFNHETNSGERIKNSVQNLTDAALFTQWEYTTFSRLTLQPGLRYAYNSNFKAPLITSLALRYAQNKNLTLRASYAQGFRAPSLRELYFLFVDENHNILGNENLQAETSDNFQLSLNYQVKSSNWKCVFSAQSFFNSIENEIRLVSVIEPDDTEPRGLFRNENIARTQTTGGNVGLKVNYQNWSLQTGVSLIGIKNNLAFSKRTNAELNQFNFFPQYQFNLNHNHERWGLQSSIFIKHTAERQQLASRNDELFLTTFEGFSLVDLNIEKGFWKDKVSVTIGLKNILNIQQINANAPIGGGAHSSGGTAIPLSVGRTFFTRLILNLP